MQHNRNPPNGGLGPSFASTSKYTVEHYRLDEARNYAGNGPRTIKFHEHSGSNSNGHSCSKLNGLPCSNPNGLSRPNQNDLTSTSNEQVQTENNKDFKVLNDRLKARLSSKLSLNELEKLRKMHGISCYSRTKREIFSALNVHNCDVNCMSNCQDRTVGKRRRDERFEWPMLINEEERKNIVTDFLDRTCKDSVALEECSFCGIKTSKRNTKEYNPNELDISYLDEKREFLRERLDCDQIEICKLNRNKYIVCDNCNVCIRRKKFERIPLYSYANGCWIGNVPPELQNLTFLEELCIARARSTRCSIKLSTGKYSQQATQGNVCIFPQEPKNLITVLPPPLHTLYDEVAVIFVNNKDTKVTAELLRKAPLLVRRQKLVNALKWLKSNNYLYRDIIISTDNLQEYSEDGSLINFPTQNIYHNDSEGSGYAPNSSNVMNVCAQSENTTVLQTCGVLDSDQQERSLSIRKIEMIRELLSNKRSYVKIPNSSSEPLSTYNNSKLYAYLWPTLFPYGIGTFEDDVRNFYSKGFRLLHTKRHVKHLLNLADTRFQTHTTFPFIMMNLLQRRTSSFESRLMVKRSCFPKIINAINKIEMGDLDIVKEKMINKSPLGDSEVEKSVATLLKYVNCISEDVCGSIGEVKKMKAEIRSIMRTKGLPHLFITINPADTMNPIMQVFAGRDVDLNQVFHDLSHGNEEYERLRASSQNPAAAARAFDFVIKAFIDVLLGKGRTDQVGVFGPVESYYGVVEAQGRGSLHCHFFIWLKDGLDPFEIRDKMKTNESWRQHFFSWLESAIKQDLPKGTCRQDLGSRKKEPLLSRPERPDKFLTYKAFNEYLNQDLRNLLHLTGQIHEHSFTCFKHLTSSNRSQKFQDKDCRFGLPRETVPYTFVDDDGHIHLVCNDGSVNGYHDIIVYCLRCNMDCKFIGSGTAAYAMTEYVTNYIAKINLDSSVIFSCLCAALAAITKIGDNATADPSSSEDKARLLLVKICNSMIGKRELSGQQVTSFLQGIPNRYTDHTFETIWWTSLLKYISKKHFCTDEQDEEDFVTIRDIDLSTNEKAQRSLPWIVADYLYRPQELSNMCLWDFWCEYKTVRRKSSDDDADDESKHEFGAKTYCFTNEHPRGHQQVLRPRKKLITPVLAGIQIPRCDKDAEDKEKFEIIALTLFRPWRRSQPVIKDDEEVWQSAYMDMFSTLNEYHKSLLRNFQAIHSCKDAADDFSKKRQKMNVHFLSSSNTDITNTGVDAEDPLEDEDWLNAMNMNIGDDTIYKDADDYLEDYFSPTRKSNVLDAVSCATSAGFYEVSKCAPIIDKGITEGSETDIVNAQKEFDVVINADPKKYLDNLLDEQEREKYHVNVSRHGEPMQETFTEENTRVDVSAPNEILHPHRLLCLDIIKRLTLNHEQALAFLLFADRYGLRHCVRSFNQEEHSPIRLIISGPGGTGKSQIFQAIRTFLHVIGHDERIKMTAPTGLAANNINGSTVHSEINIRIPPREMLRNDMKGKNRRQQLEKRYQNVMTQVIDEIYFMSARDNAVLSQYMRLAQTQGVTDQAYGKLNMIFAGDPAQLPPPKQMSLFDHRLVQQAENNLNATNEIAKSNLSGIVIWREITDCIVLRKIMRQKDKHFQDMLNRLRFGNCSDEDFSELESHVLENRSVEINKNLLNISLWLTDPDNASPLITYTNAVRDAHNTHSAEAFALLTNQEYYEYHSVDTVDRGKTVLTNLAAQAAWDTPVKRGHDLAGKLPLIPYMPIFLTQNLATQQGLSNGGFGRLISAKYIIKEGLRYAISAVIEINQYHGGPKDHPNRLTIVPVKSQMSYNLPGKAKSYSATRLQLPIIPAFAFTAHNSQSRSLNRACIDLESCPSTPATYVMLSRLRSMNGLSILRPFSYKKISRHSPQETRNEIARLDNLHEDTMRRSEVELRWYFNNTS